MSFLLVLWPPSTFLTADFPLWLSSVSNNNVMNICILEYAEAFQVLSYKLSLPHCEAGESISLSSIQR